LPVKRPASYDAGLFLYAEIIFLNKFFKK